MGSQGVLGCLFIVTGAVHVGRVFSLQVRARRSGTGTAALTAEEWVGLSGGLSILSGGVLYLRNPRLVYGSWLGWITWALFGTALMFMIVPWIVSRRRARRLGLGPAPAPGPGSADVPGPGPVITPDASTARLIERIKNVKFSTVRLARGYDEEEVDIFLDTLVAAFSQDGELDRSGLRDVTFSTTRLRPGYAMPDVDTFLEEVAQAAR
jgi:DivIVA domain-containing protein